MGYKTELISNRIQESLVPRQLGTVIHIHIHINLSEMYPGKCTHCLICGYFLQCHILNRHLMFFFLQNENQSDRLFILNKDNTYEGF